MILRRQHFITLYAHLASVGRSIVVGARVESGTKLGIMGAFGFLFDSSNTGAFTL